MIVVASGRFDLTKTLGSSSYIYSRCEWSSSGNVSTNKSTINIKVIVGKRSGSNTPTKCTFNTTVSVSGADSPSSQSSSPYDSVSANEEITVFSGTFTIKHNDNGKKSTTISVSIGNNNVYHAEGSSSITLDTIPRASSISGGSGNIGEKVTINISRASSSFKHTLNYEFGNLSGTIGTDIGTSCEWLIPTTFYNQIPNANEGTGTIICITYDGSTEIGRKSISFTSKVTNSNPSSFDFMYADIGGMTPNENITVHLTGDDTKIIKGYSSLFVMITSEASGNNGASISYYQIDNEKVYVADMHPVQFQIENYNKKTITVLVVDTRGNSTSITKTITNFLEYEDLVKGNIKLSRSNGGVGEFVTLEFNGTFWNDSFGEVNNDLSVAYKYKKTNSSDFIQGTTNIVTTNNENKYSFNGLIEGDTEEKGFDINNSYDLIVQISDKINTVIFETYIGAGTPAIAIFQNFVSLGKKYDVSLGGIQLWGDIYINGSKFQSYSNEEQLVGTWMGKPLYRKVLEGKMPDTTESWVDLIDLSNLKIEDVIKLDGTIKNTLTDFRILPANGYEKSAYHSLFSYLGNTKKLQVFLGGWQTATFGFVYRVILEYTKTTD